MATITAEFAAAAKAKAQHLVPEAQVSPKKAAAEVAEVRLLLPQDLRACLAGS